MSDPEGPGLDLTPYPLPGKRVRAVGEYVPEPWRIDPKIDIDRIEYALEFRRLAGVTQVVPPQDGYLFHNRLTHSMKVASVAATIARQLVYAYEDDDVMLAEVGPLGFWVDPDYCYAAALAHDIGHPPFGHAGEQALQGLLGGTWAKPKMRAHSFEGNAQSTRILVDLSFRKLHKQGLELTQRTVAAVAKYPWLRGHHPHVVPKLARKWSFYDTESDVLKDLIDDRFIAVERTPWSDLTAEEREALDPDGTGEWRSAGRTDRVHRWPEAEIMDWADDVSYAVHDMEDFFMSGLIPLHRITVALRAAPGVEEFDWEQDSFSFTQNDLEVRDALRFARDKMAETLDENGQSLRAHVNAAFDMLRANMIEAMPSRRFDGSARAHTQLHAFGSSGIRLLTENCQLEVFAVAGRPRLRFVVPPKLRLVAEFFKAICRFYVIDTSAVRVMQAGQKRLLLELIEALLEMAGESKNQFKRVLPSRLAEFMDRGMPSTDDADDVVRSYQLAVVDYVCSLRDAQAEQIAIALTGRDGTLTLPGNWLDT